MSIEPDGWSRPCCGETQNNARIAPISEGFKNAFNNHKLIFLKQELEENGFTDKTRAYCSRCEAVEDGGFQSLRDPTFLTEARELKKIQFKLSNQCQLACAHCGPELSSTWRKVLNIKPLVTGFEVTDEMLNELGELMPQLTEIKFTGGEPFLQPAHWNILEFLEKFDRSHCQLEYISNGLVRPRNTHLWKGWKKVHVSVSVDGFKSTYEWFRRGSNWEELVNNVAALRTSCNLSLNYSMTPWTIADSLKAEEFWGEPIHRFPLVHPRHANLALFPRSVAEEHFDHSLPFFDMTSKEVNDLTLFKKWAKSWDEKWSTPGLAEELFPWLK